MVQYSKRCRVKLSQDTLFPTYLILSTNSSGHQYLGTHLQVLYAYTYIFYKNVHLVCTFLCILLLIKPIKLLTQSSQQPYYL